MYKSEVYNTFMRILNDLVILNNTIEVIVFFLGSLVNIEEKKEIDGIKYYKLFFYPG